MSELFDLITKQQEFINKIQKTAYREGYKAGFRDGIKARDMKKEEEKIMRIDEEVEGYLINTDQAEKELKENPNIPVIE